MMTERQDGGEESHKGEKRKGNPFCPQPTRPKMETSVRDYTLSLSL